MASGTPLLPVGQWLEAEPPAISPARASPKWRDAGPGGSLSTGDEIVVPGEPLDRGRSTTQPAHAGAPAQSPPRYCRP
ncbi:hypothetical protein DSL92_00330 [Billgrantia gudaonensis]|uniref:Uncharacterized protein n=1 Tax=Billgrantia gudaonensis TaxID=376427 RepID=A0A432JKV7_9GAMM|nr:hypothetical protein DSL92_00330 [Halomonas gudaonensis]